MEVPPGRVVAFLHPLPVEAMWGVGPSTARRLHALGLETVGDLAHVPPATLRQTFGPHSGRVLQELAWGRDGRRGRAPLRGVHPTWIRGRRAGSGSFSRMISRTTGAVSPWPSSR